MSAVLVLPVMNPCMQTQKLRWLTYDDRTYDSFRQTVDYHGRSEAVLAVLQSPVLTHGPQGQQFEADFAKFLGEDCHCIAVSFHGGTPPSVPANGGWAWR